MLERLGEAAWGSLTVHRTALEAEVDVKESVFIGFPDARTEYQILKEETFIWLLTSEDLVHNLLALRQKSMAEGSGGGQLFNSWQPGGRRRSLRQEHTLLGCDPGDLPPPARLHLPKSIYLQSHHCIYPLICIAAPCYPTIFQIQYL